MKTPAPNMIRNLKRKDVSNFILYCLEKNNEDFYLFNNHNKQSINNLNIIKKVLKNILQYGDKCFIEEENDEIRGLCLIVGYSDKSKNKYLKILADTTRNYHRLLKYTLWNYKLSLGCRTKKDSFLIPLLKKYKFEFRKNLDNDIILVKPFYKEATLNGRDIRNRDDK